MISKTKLFERAKNKENDELVETIIACKKNDKWLEVGKIISAPRRKKISINLDKISEESKEGETIIVPGKVLSQGDLVKKIRLVALNFSKMAEEKLKKAKVEYLKIINEIKKNPDAKGIKIIQ
ncbi:50S ribosomal protein L18e [Candidatus Pacearchaeota archaeon]|nr:50S ribosomal protein L18e [Candidatus Pacearchaeota archaeon]